MIVLTVNSVQIYLSTCFCCRKRTTLMEETFARREERCVTGEGGGVNGGRGEWR